MSSQYAESFTLLGLGLVFIIVRVYVRWTQVGPSNFQLDDYLMPLAGVRSLVLVPGVSAHTFWML
jgi:hypothetical protein